MSRQFSILYLLSATLFLTAGCTPQQPFFFREDGDLSHYIGKATDIEFPDVEAASLDEVTGALPPMTLGNPDPKEIWELTLEEAVRIALANSKVIRTLPGIGFGQTDPTPDTLQNNPDRIPTVFDPALTETGNGFTSPLGVEAALADFDANFDSFVRWDKTVRPQNVAGFVTAFRPEAFSQELGTFQAQLSKTTAAGTTWYLRHNVNYDWNNAVASRLFASDWGTSLEAEFSQPLLQGNGVQFTRIYGPRQTSAFGNAAALGARRPEQYRGVMIARINANIALADFEAQVLNMVSDVENAYWNLYLAYRNLDTLVEGRNMSLDTWRDVQAEREVGKGDAQDEAQARHQYFEFEGAVEEAQNQVFTAERNLRYMMGLAATDGRLIRPADEPTTAEVHFDWSDIHAEAMVRSVNLRRQKDQIKRRELELIAAKNLLLPELNAGGIYRWRGLGDDLIDPSGNPPFSPGDSVDERSRKRLDNAYATMSDGEFQEWSLALNLSVPLGFRRELAGVRNAELRMARDRAVLQEMELELSHDMAGVLGDLEKSYKLAQTRFNQRLAAQIELEGWEAQEEAGLAVRQASLDRKLDAQRRLATSEINYYRALIDYNKAIVQMHLRKGSLLEYNGVYLAEGPWPAKAYFDATRRARARDASYYLDYGFTRPKVISRGKYQQHAGRGDVILEAGPALPLDGAPEPIPAPEPEPMPPSASDLEPKPDATSSLGRAAPQIVQARPATQPPRHAGSNHRPKPNANKYDLGSLNLKLLAGNTTQPRTTSSDQQPAVRQVSHQEVGSVASGTQPQDPQGQWKGLKESSPPRESAAGPSPAEPGQTASGWRSASH